MPNLQRGGAHASILLTFLCNFAVLAMAQWPPLNTPLGAKQAYYRQHLGQIPSLQGDFVFDLQDEITISTPVASHFARY